jgi:hypothetical protein
MSNWIPGKQLIKKIQPIELFEEYVKKGIQPYSQAGRALTPYDVLENIYDEMLAGADQGKSPLTIEGNETDGGDKVVYVSNSATLEIHIQHQLNRVEDVSWQDFQLPENDSEASAVLNQLCQCLYKKDEVSGKPKHKQAKKLRPEQLARKSCRAVAKELWAQEVEPPYTRSKDMSKRPELVEASGGVYQPETIRRWIANLAPDRDPGRRVKKK